VGRDGNTNLFILAITSQRPTSDRMTMTVPEIERRRAGLDHGLPLWIVLDEYNHDVLELSTYLEPAGRIGEFSPAFHKKVVRTFRDGLRAGAAKRVPRSS